MAAVVAEERRHTSGEGVPSVVRGHGRASATELRDKMGAVRPGALSVARSGPREYRRALT